MVALPRATAQAQYYRAIAAAMHSPDDARLSRRLFLPSWVMVTGSTMLPKARRCIVSVVTLVTGVLSTTSVVVALSASSPPFVLPMSTSTTRGTKVFQTSTEVLG